MDEYEELLKEVIATQRRVLSILTREVDLFKQQISPVPSSFEEEKTHVSLALSSLLRKKRKFEREDRSLKENSEYQSLYEQFKTLRQKIKDLTVECKNLNHSYPMQNAPLPETKPKKRPLMLEDDV